MYIHSGIYEYYITYIPKTSIPSITRIGTKQTLFFHINIFYSFRAVLEIPFKNMPFPSRLQYVFHSLSVAYAATDYTIYLALPSA